MLTELRPADGEGLSLDSVSSMILRASGGGADVPCSSERGECSDSHSAICSGLIAECRHRAQCEGPSGSLCGQTAGRFQGWMSGSLVIGIVVFSLLVLTAAFVGDVTVVGTEVKAVG
jgi:hypothetical protein